MQKERTRQWTAIGVAVLLLPVSPIRSEPKGPADYVTRPYLDLAEMASTVRLDLQAMDAYRAELGRQRKTEQERLKIEEKQLEQEVARLREQLKALNQESSEDTP